MPLRTAGYRGEGGVHTPSSWDSMRTRRSREGATLSMRASILSAFSGNTSASRLLARALCSCKFGKEGLAGCHELHGNRNEGEGMAGGEGGVWWLQRWDQLR